MYRLTVAVVVLVDTLLLRVLRFRDKNPLARRVLADPGPDHRIIGDVLGDNVHCALQRGLGTVYTLVRIYIFGSLIKRLTLAALLHNPVRQRLQPSFLGYACSCLAFLLVRTVQIFDFLQLDRLHNLRLKLRSQLALLLNAADNVLLAVT
ncbi:hypothetical protein D3C80_1735140 [compost metagenome]